MERKSEADAVMRTWTLEVGGHRKIGRPKLRWSDVTRKDTKETRVKIEEPQGRRTWRLETRYADPIIKEKAEEEEEYPLTPTL